MRHSRSSITLLTLVCLITQFFPAHAQRPIPDIKYESTAHASPISGEELWQQFRETYPFHIQTLAFDKKSHTLIISEPPPHVTLANLKEALQRYNPALNPAMNVETKRIGVDGWVKDIVMQFPPMSEAQTSDAIDAIQQHIFHTTYKAYVIPLTSAKKPVLNSDKLDLNVSIAEVKKWLFDDKERFSPLLGGNSQTTDELLTNRKSGIYFSKDRGLVIWSINRKRPISNYLIEARQFALDSDIIVGAVGSTDQIIIVGRERFVPVEVLPPLRTETIMLLASVKDDELAQSYERNHILAGRFNATQDWAPIYLSDALIDTEYGSLLNITDQLLKSWSNNGLIKYQNFDYPAPLSWSRNWCFESPLQLKAQNEKGATSLTYNWNTKGVGYTTEINGHQFFALNRTGSLPTSYLIGENENNVNEYEEKGYRCFATIGDPNLARVVQYAALYQIFRKYPVRGDDSFVKKPIKPQHDVLTDYTEKALKSFYFFVLENSNAPDLSQKAREKLALYRDRIGPIIEAFGDKGGRALSQAVAHPRLSETERHQLGQLLQQLNATGRNGFESAFAKLPKDQQIQLMAYLISSLLLEDKVARELIVDPRIIDLNKVKDDYIASSKRDNDVWIRTASVVISQAIDQLTGIVGGHDLSATTTSFKPNPEIEVGKVKIILQGKRVLYEFNPADLPKVPRLVRDASMMAEGRRMTPELSASIKARLESDLVPPPPPPRSINMAMAMPEGPRPPGRGFTTDGGNGWHPELIPVVIPDEARTAVSYGDVAVLVDRQPKGEGFEYTLTTADGKAIKAHSMPSAIDAVVSIGRNTSRENPKVAFVLKGFTEDEAKGFLYNTDLHLKNSSLTGFVEPSGTELFLAQAKAVEYNLPGVNVGEHSIRQITEGQYKGLYELGINFDVPAQVAAKPSLKIRLEMFYRNLVSDPTVTGVKNAIKSFFNRPISADTNMNAVIVDLANQLRAINPDAKNILTTWKRDTSGIIITEFRLLQRNERNLREARKSE